MSFLLELSPDARAELQAGIDWYEQRSPGRGESFADEVASVLTRIRESPALFARWDDDPRYRRAFLRRFPFAIVFSMRAELIYVAAIAHSSRADGYWRR